MKYIDIGVNLFSRQFAGREDAIVENAKNAGVGMIITGSSLSSSQKAAAYVAGREGDECLYATAGVHPHDAKDCSEKTIAALRTLVTGNDRVIAVGECGLDYDRMFSPADVQRHWFTRQVELAEELGMPLFLHERAASEDFVQILQGHPDACRRAVVHCFTGTRQEAEQYLALGCCIGITGWVCDERRNADLLDALAVIPVERLLAETDAPYLKPRGIRGLKGANVPDNIPHVVAKMAEVKGVDEDALAAVLLQNTRQFFGIN